MMIEKELSEIALDITESQYRAMPELSYSNLSTYERTGYNGLDHLFDKIESPSLTLGSIVDTILTGGEDEFKDKFTVLDVNVTDGGKNVCKQLISMNLPYDSFENIPQGIVSNAAKEAGFWKGAMWNARRYHEVLNTGNIAALYNASIHADRTIIDTDTYNDAIAMVKALREAPATSGYFADNDELSPIKRYYQLKFKAKLQGVWYKCMADLLVVNYEKKKIFPIDLKTSGYPEWDFTDSFSKWNYMIQARLYWRIINECLSKDPYFKDFTLENYRFIVVNKKTLTPLVWEFPLTKTVGTLIDSYGKKYKDPFEIGKELRQYLDLKPPVPNGINKDGVNIIDTLYLES